MASKIFQHHIEAQRPPCSPEDLRRLFETAVCEIHQADLATEKKVQYGIPIVSRAKILRISKDGAEKRALSDAARALAQLWKV